jgi:hypothetical protein
VLGLEGGGGDSVNAPLDRNGYMPSCVPLTGHRHRQQVLDQRRTEPATSSVLAMRNEPTIPTGQTLPSTLDQDYSLQDMHAVDLTGRLADGQRSGPLL